MTEATVLNVQHLTKNFKKNTAIDDLSFTLGEGHIVALTGPNGAGKTTTLKCIIGLLNPTKGQIEIMGQDNRSDLAKVNAGYIPEIPELYPMLTIWQHLKFIALAYRLTGWESAAEGMLREFDLFEKKDELCKSLSKGMKQKVSIICALLHNSQLILVDEPMVGLDPKAIREFKNLLLRLREEGRTILLSTHMLDTAENLCDEVMVMNKGSLIFKGTLEELKEMLHAGDNTTLEELFLEVTGAVDTPQPEEAAERHQ